jgi:hypothetical protein
MLPGNAGEVTEEGFQRVVGLEIVDERLDGDLRATKDGDPAQSIGDVVINGSGTLIVASGGSSSLRRSPASG